VLTAAYARALAEFLMQMLCATILRDLTGKTEGYAVGDGTSGFWEKLLMAALDPNQQDAGGTIFNSLRPIRPCFLIFVLPA